jgi:ATP synthase protein I
MSADDDPREAEYVRMVREKAQRLFRARQREGGFWRHLAHVGSLGFVFVLPLVAGAALGHAVAERTGRPIFALALLFLGLLVGAFGSWRLIRQSFGGDGE